MNKQEYNELNLIISYIALLVDLRSTSYYKKTLKSLELLQLLWYWTKAPKHFKKGGGGDIYNLCGIRPKHSNISKGGGYYNLCGIEIKIVAMLCFISSEIYLFLALFIHT
jgi:hypothetical protein